MLNVDAISGWTENNGPEYVVLTVRDWRWMLTSTVALYNWEEAQENAKYNSWWYNVKLFFGIVPAPPEFKPCPEKQQLWVMENMQPGHVVAIHTQSGWIDNLLAYGILTPQHARECYEELKDVPHDDLTVAPTTC